MSQVTQPKVAQQPDEASLLAEYAEVNDNIRELTSIRFQLLAFLPVGTILGAFLLTADDVGFRPVLALFGLAVTIGLMIYNERNDQIYGELISRAKQLEQRLHLHDGQYNERLSAWQSLKLVDGTPLVRINHSSGINIIYAVSLIAWLYAIFFAILSWTANLVGRVAAALVGADVLNWWPYVGTIAPPLVAMALSVTIVWLAKRRLGAQQESRREQMRSDAKDVIDQMKNLHFPSRSPKADEWQTVYDCLVRIKEGAASSAKEPGKAKDKLTTRAKYYLSEAAAEEYPFEMDAGGELGVRNACFLACRLTGLPARWFMDQHTGGRA